MVTRNETSPLRGPAGCGRLKLTDLPTTGGVAPAGPANGRTVPFHGRATPRDIFYCFRLLLGRHPNPEEWRGHASRTGDDLAGVVTSFARSLECAQRRLFAAEAADTADEVVVTPWEGFSICSAADDALIGRGIRAGEYEPEIAALFRRFLRPGMNVLDLGANIGFFTLLAASLVGPDGQVHAVEPNPRNARLLEMSRRLNRFEQVRIWQVAAAAAHGLLVLSTSYSNGTTSRLPELVASLAAAQTVPALRLDALLPTELRIDFVKVDVEGAEYDALRGCEQIIQRHRPVIVSEFSPHLMPGISGVSGEAYLAWLLACGYRLAVVNLDGSLGDAETDVARIMAAYYARKADHVDLLALPDS